jgi:hypothetical protein
MIRVTRTKQTMCKETGHAQLFYYSAGLTARIKLASRQNVYTLFREYYYLSIKTRIYARALDRAALDVNRDATFYMRASSRVDLLTRQPRIPHLSK